jgi:hypothetical protein
MHSNKSGRQLESPGRTRRFVASARAVAGFADDFVGGWPVEKRGLVAASLSSVLLSIVSAPFDYAAAFGQEQVRAVEPV